MELKELEAALEGGLFAAGEPVGVERLCLEHGVSEQWHLLSPK